MQLIYKVNDKPKFSQAVVFAFQQMIAIIAATLLVPMLVSLYGLQCDPAAALFGAGVGTIVYIILTKFKSPVFLGSSFTFLGALQAAAASNYGYWGLIIGVAFATLVYVIVALVVKFVGSKWVSKLLPAIIVGPIVAIIGLSLSGTATGWMSTNNSESYSLIYILTGLVTFAGIVLASVKGTKKMKQIPFIVGIGFGFVFALILSVFGYAFDVAVLKVVDFGAIKEGFSTKSYAIQWFFDVPKFTFVEAIKTNGTYPLNGTAILNLFLLFAPIGVVELAQHISDHIHLGKIIEQDLITDPGLDKTLLGDGLGSAVGAFFGGCANTTYGESIGCVAISGNAAVITIIYASIGCMLLSFFTPFVVILNAIPKCVMGGACLALYGFIAVSGLHMLQDVDLNDSKNLYPVAAILVIGVGGLVLDFGSKTINGVTSPIIELSSLAVALIVGILTNLLTHSKGSLDKEDSKEEAISADEA